MFLGLGMGGLGLRLWGGGRRLLVLLVLVLVLVVVGRGRFMLFVGWGMIRSWRLRRCLRMPLGLRWGACGILRGGLGRGEKGSMLGGRSIDV